MIDSVSPVTGMPDWIFYSGLDAKQFGEVQRIVHIVFGVQG
jgi:hypothetical protein